MKKLIVFVFLFGSFSLKLFAEGDNNIHKWNFTTNGNTIIANCENEECSYNENPVSLNIKFYPTEISATVIPFDAHDKSLTWTSSNTEVAKVDNYGNIKPIQQGSTQITASANDGSGVVSNTVTVEYKKLFNVIFYKKI